MRNSNRSRQVVTLLVFVFLIALIAGQLLGQPVGISYVKTDSMSPTIEPGDGFIAIPTQVDNSLQEGDVIVFRAEQLHGGGLTTHRIVDKTARGYITRGDANPFTDQDGTEPPVKHPQVVAQALQINSHIVVIPHFGTVVEGVQGFLNVVQTELAALLNTRSLLGTQGLAYLFFATTLLWYLVGVFRNKDTTLQKRDTSRTTGMDTRLVIAAFTALLVIGATAAMLAPAGTQEYGIVSAEYDSENPTVIPIGESEEVAYHVHNSGPVPITVYLKPASDGIAIQPNELSVQGRSVANARVTLQAPPETGYYRRYLVEHRYLALLPSSVIRSLYAVHPWAPIVVIDMLIGVPFYLLGTAFVGNGRIRPRVQDQHRSLAMRLRQLLRQLY